MKEETVEMVALQDTYYGVQRKKGETFLVKKENVNILVQTKRAELLTRAEVAEEEPAKAKQKREYKRRDMKAES